MGLLARRRARIHCAHQHVRGIYGDEVHLYRGYRLQCTDCGTLLSGPVSISVERTVSNGGDLPKWRGCTVPPDGWWCSRTALHLGPCAAWPGEHPPL